MLEKNVKIINMTPHDINYFNASCPCDDAPNCYHKPIMVCFKPSGIVPRIEKSSNLFFFFEAEEVEHLVFDRPKTKKVVNLPAQKENILIIVSSMVRKALPKRTDLISPTRFERDENGHIDFCTAFDVNF